jgi:hypothetical protein
LKEALIMQTNIAIEQMLNLSACYLGLRDCRFDAATGSAHDARDQAPEQGGSSDSSQRCAH